MFPTSFERCDALAHSTFSLNRSHPRIRDPEQIHPGYIFGGFRHDLGWTDPLFEHNN